MHPVLIEAALANTGARPSNLIVEMTERALLDISAAKPVIAGLRARGIDVAFDDFGTGYSSLSYFASFELDFLKIDCAFIEAVGTRSPTDQVVHHIIAIAQTMNLRMIAEGVETESQADYLLARGMQYAQGWLFAKAMPWEEFHAAFRWQRFGTSRAAPNHRNRAQPAQGDSHPFLAVMSRACHISGLRSFHRIVNPCGDSRSRTRSGGDRRLQRKENDDGMVPGNAGSPARGRHINAA